MAISSSLVGSLGGSKPQEIPVSRSAMNGTGTTHTLLTVPASGRRLITVIGSLTHSTTNTTYYPDLKIGSSVLVDLLSGPITFAAVVTTATDIAVVTRHGSIEVAISATVYVTDLD